MSAPHTEKLTKLLINMSDMDTLLWKHKIKKAGQVSHRYKNYNGKRQAYTHLFSIKYDGSAGGNAFESTVEFTKVHAKELVALAELTPADYGNETHITFSQEGHVYKSESLETSERDKLWTALYEAMIRQGNMLMEITLDTMLDQFPGKSAA